MKKVTITTRVIYHKIASVTIDVPDDIPNDKVQDWIWENEHLFTDELDQNLSKASYDYGFGISDDMDWIDQESETRYDVNENGEIAYGGHL
jgi:hypothetical protein